LLRERNGRRSLRSLRKFAVASPVPQKKKISRNIVSWGEDGRRRRCPEGENPNYEKYRKREGKPFS